MGGKNSHEYYAAYYARNREAQLAKSKAYALAHPAETKARRKAHYDKNAEEMRAYSRAWAKNNKEHRQKVARRWRGLPEPTRPAPSHCELCGKLPNGHGKTLHLDHDHETGKFRGWICSTCNTGLGKLGDSVEGLIRAIAYLEKL